MKTKNGFTLLENEKDIKDWIAKQHVSRTITKLQVHHMDAPSYSTWEKTDKKVFSEPHFGRTKSLDSYGKSKWGSAASDGHGHHIAQHFNVFPDGKITTGRNLNSTPIGIRGWNDHAICIEIYGCFDKGHDTMTAAQKKAVICLYGELCKKFKLTPNTTHIRPHCWFTYTGTYLGKYDVNKSAKTCPGTAFWGYGCSPSGFAHFIKDVQTYLNGKDVVEKKPETTTKFKQYIARCTTDGLNCRKGAGVNYGIETVLNKGEVFTVVLEKKVDGSTWVKSKSGYWCNKKYLEFVRYV